MNLKSNSSFSFPVTRRSFLKTGAVRTTGLASLGLHARAKVNQNSKLRIFQIGVGGIGELQRNGLKGHPQVELDRLLRRGSARADKITKQFPGAWTVKDYREGFANRLGDFDAVIVDVPDFHHAPMVLTAFKHNK